MRNGNKEENIGWFIYFFFFFLKRKKKKKRRKREIKWGSTDRHKG
jgi:hypothetical protein